MIVTVCRKPIMGSIIDNVKKNDCGGLFIDKCRVAKRWPANVLISEKDEKIMNKQSGILKSGAMNSIAKGGQHTTYGKMYERRVVNSASVGGASRFFKVVKE